MNRKERVQGFELTGDWSDPFWWSYIPIADRRGQEYFEEVDRRAEMCAKRDQSGPTGRRQAEALNALGDQIFLAAVEARLNPTQLSELAGVDEMLLVFAEDGMVEPHELTEGDFLAKVSRALSQALGREVKLDFELRPTLYN